MLNFKKFSLLPVLAATCLNYAVADEKIQRLSIISCDSAHSGDKLHISLCGKFDSDVSFVNCEIIIDNRFFYLYKTQFTSDLFDIKIQKADDNMKKIILSLKKDVTLKTPDDNAEIVSLDLNVKKKCPSGDSKIDFNVDYVLSSGDKSNEKIEKNISVNPKEKIVSVGVNGSDLPRNNNGDYKITVPSDINEVCIDVSKTDGTNIKSEKITKTLNKIKDTKIKIADKEIVISKEKIQNPKKNESKTKSKIVNKKNNKKLPIDRKNSIIVDSKKEDNKTIVKNSNDEKPEEENVIEEIDNKSDSSKVSTTNIEHSNTRKLRLIPSSCLLVLTMTACGVIMIKKKSSNTKGKNNIEQNQPSTK